MGRCHRWKRIFTRLLERVRRDRAGEQVEDQQHDDRRDGHQEPEDRLGVLLLLSVLLLLLPVLLLPIALLLLLLLLSTTERRPAKATAHERVAAEEHPEEFLGVDFHAVKRGCILGSRPAAEPAESTGRHPIRVAVSVVRGPLIRTGQHRERPAHLFECLIGPFSLVLIWVQLEGQLSVRAFDLVVVCRLRDQQYVVVTCLRPDEFDEAMGIRGRRSTALAARSGRPAVLRGRPAVLRGRRRGRGSFGGVCSPRRRRRPVVGHCSVNLVEELSDAFKLWEQGGGLFRKLAGAAHVTVG